MGLTEEQRDFLKPLVTIPNSYNSVQIASAASAAVRKAGFPVTAGVIMSKFISECSRESALNLAAQYCIVKEV